MKICVCGEKMALKKNRYNKRIFWGCSDYPQCEHSEDIDADRQEKANAKYNKDLRKRLQEEVDEEEGIKGELRTAKSELEHNKKDLVASYFTQMVLFNVLTTLKFSMSRLEAKDAKSN